MRRPFLTLAPLMLLFLSKGADAQMPNPPGRFELQVAAGTRGSLIEATCASRSSRQVIAAVGLLMRSAQGIGGRVELALIRRCERQTFTYYQPHVSVVGELVKEFGHTRVRPFVAFGGGVVSHAQIAASARYPRERFTLVGGGGVHIGLTRRLALMPQFQIGEDGNVFTRFSVAAGLSLR